MADIPPSAAVATTTKTLTLTTSSLFLTAYTTYSATLSPPPTPPLSFHLLSSSSPLPPLPPTLPPSKLIPTTRFLVDAFRSAADSSVTYFLSHFHSDHYTGLGPTWSRGLIFCSPITARLLINILNVPQPFVIPLPLSETTRIDGCSVTAIDANHCPGAVQFLFDLSQGKYIHTGDFRFCDSMKSDPHLRRFVGADVVFLDTTYCDPKFQFPSQDVSVKYIVNTIQKIKNQNKGSPVLFLIATYVVGKEKILIEIAQQCDCLVTVNNRKMRILSNLGLADSGVFTEDAAGSDVHVIGWNLLGDTWPYFRPNFEKMRELAAERGYSNAVGFVPTGWMYETKKDGFAVRAKDSLEIHLVPYSEHSSYDELREYVSFLRPKRVIPTVGTDVEKLDSKQALALQKHFSGLVDETANKQDFLMSFHQKAGDHEVKAINETTNSRDVLPEDVDKKGEGSKLLNDDCLEGAVDEVRDCLPSWASQDQILGLLRDSGGDIVKAISEFFENETQFYEQANACTPPGSDSRLSFQNGAASFPDLKPSQENLDYKQKMDVASFPDLKPSQEKVEYNRKVFLPQDKKQANKSTAAPKKQANKNTAAPKSSVPKKRVTDGGNKPKKKGKPSTYLESSGAKQSTITNFFGKASTNLDSSGAKQSTITNFFGKLASDTSGDNICGTTTGGQQSANGIPLLDRAVEMYKEELDTFFQIINGGMDRDSASILMEKAEGNIDVAVDMYYGNSSNIAHSKGSLVSSSVQANIHVGLVASCVDKASYVSKEAKNLPTLFVHGAPVEDANVNNVSLPTELYDPVEHACWKAEHPAPYLHLARTFDLVEQEKGKKKTTTMLCNMFRSLLALSPDDVLPAVYLCTNNIAADHENMELNIGESLVVAALEEACGTSKSKIKVMYKISGDLGDVAQECRHNQSLLAPPRPLSLHHLFSTLRRISVESGSGSTVRRKNLVVNLMHSCREGEMKFLVRTLVRNLRIGAMMKTILPALAQAVVWNNCSSMHLLGSTDNLKMQLQGISAAVTEAYNVTPNLDLLVPSLLSKGIEFSASSLEMVPGMPIPPMLARITNGVVQVLKLFQNRAFTCEYKYDGQRAQIHKLEDGSIKVFSRQRKETTTRFPDLVNVIKELCNSAILTFILDAEIVAIDRKNGGKIMSFQELSARERGTKDFSIKIDSIKVDICIFVFDVMFSNGERLLALPLRQRRKYLKDLFHKEKLGYLEFAKEITVEADESSLSNMNSLTKINSFFEDAFNSSCEGIMAKALDISAAYSASERSESWLKVKRDYVEGLGDSLDLIPIGAWHGNGRKAGWYSPFLMACYNPDAEEYQSVCRVMSGFSDSFYDEMKEFFSGERILAKKPPYYRTDESPDLWFTPQLVWEIRGADLTVSPVHHAAVGLVHPSRGISVRLPRYVRSVLDREPEDCSTSADIAYMFQSQTRKMEVNKEE